MNIRQKVVFFVFLDALIIYFTIIISYLLRFEGDIPYTFSLGIPYLLTISLFITVSIFFAFNLYRRVWEYASIGELISIIRAITLSILLITGTYVVLRSLHVNIFIPPSVFLTMWVLMILWIGGSRLFIRVYLDDYARRKKCKVKNALIIGAGYTGATIAKELRKGANQNIYVVGFIDDDPQKLHMSVVGIPVIGTRKEIQDIVQTRSIDLIVIAMPTVSKEEVAKIIHICKEMKVQIKLVPSIQDVINGKVNLDQIRDVQVEDLLGREPVDVDLNEIASYVTNQVVLVTGAGGSIGSEICRQVARFDPREMILLGRGENSLYGIEMELKKRHPDLPLTVIVGNIQEEFRIRSIFQEYRPHVVFHAAAHKHVPMMENNPIEAIKNNIFGTKVVAECAHRFGATHFVMLSTDKAVNPTSVMGVTKRIAEMIIQQLDKTSHTKFAAVRFGNVLGSRGSVIPLFKQQIKEGGPVTVTDPNMVRYFMTVTEAAQLVIQAGAFSLGGEVFVLDMGKPVKIVSLAEDLIRLCGLELEKDIKIVYTGIRPGEKLYEELLLTDSEVSSTRHNRIYVEKPIDFDGEHFFFMLRVLEQKIRKTNIAHDEVKQFLMKIVPTYHDPMYRHLEKPETQSVSNELVLASQETAVARME